MLQTGLFTTCSLLIAWGTNIPGSVRDLVLRWSLSHTVLTWTFSLCTQIPGISQQLQISPLIRVPFVMDQSSLQQHHFAFKDSLQIQLHFEVLGIRTSTHGWGKEQNSSRTVVILSNSPSGSNTLGILLVNLPLQLFKKATNWVRFDEETSSQFSPNRSKPPKTLNQV